MPVTNLTDLYSIGNIQTEAGSEHASIALIDSSGAISSTWCHLPVIMSSTVKDETEVPTKQSESNNTYYLSHGKRQASFILSFMQNDAAARNFHETYGNKHCVVIKQTYEETINGKLSFDIFPNCLISKKYNKKNPGLEFEQEFLAMPQIATVTLNLVSATKGFSLPTTCASYVLNTAQVDIAGVTQTRYKACVELDA